MRILKILPGTGGGFLCENCLRDQALVAELRWAGHDVTLVPLYLPIAGTAPSEDGAFPLFYGAIRVYLEHRFPLLRNLPAWLRRKLDSPRLLLKAAQRAKTTSSPALADLTLSVLRGENGDQAGELDALCDWLRDQPPPDVIHLSNALLLGLARRIGLLLKVPVVCSLQDEDTWIDAMPGPLANRAWAEIRARVPDVAAFIATSHYFAAKMPRRMGMPLRNVRPVHPGIDLAALPFREAAPSPPAWGVLLDGSADPEGVAKVCTAFAAVRAVPACRSLRLRVAGAAPSRDLAAALASHGLAGDVEFLPGFPDQRGRIDFLRGLTLFTVLHRDEPAFDLSLLEAMATGVVTVQPDAGANPEILAMAEGGVLFDPSARDSLAQAVADLAADPVRVQDLSRRGRRGVEHQFSLGRMARETVDVYQAVCTAHQPLRPSFQRRPAPGTLAP